MEIPGEKEKRGHCSGQADAQQFKKVEVFPLKC
jgi:hypothetical protein